MSKLFRTLLAAEKKPVTFCMYNSFYNFLGMLSSFIVPGKCYLVKMLRSAHVRLDIDYRHDALLVFFDTLSANLGWMLWLWLGQLRSSTLNEIKHASHCLCFLH